MSLLIVIINYRTPRITIDCLQSLSGQIGDVPGTHVVLVDNASGDDSVAQITGAISANNWSSWITFIASPKNAGFAGGNNVGIKMIATHFPNTRQVLLLNSDTIAQPGVLARCVNIMEADRGIGVMSCMLLNRDGSVQNTARRLPQPLRLAAYSFGLPWLLPRFFNWADLDDPRWDRKTESRDVDWVGGAFMLIRREVIDRIGGLDERFFFYGEDAAYCRHVWKAGWRVRYDPSSAVIHLGGASSDPTRVASRARNAMMWQARYLLQRTCYGRGAEWFIRGVDIASFGLRYLKLRLRGRKNTPEFATMRDVLSILLDSTPGAPSPVGRS